MMKISNTLKNHRVVTLVIASMAAVLLAALGPSASALSGGQPHVIPLTSIGDQPTAPRQFQALACTGWTPTDDGYSARCTASGKPVGDRSFVIGESTPGVTGSMSIINQEWSTNADGSGVEGVADVTLTGDGVADALTLPGLESSMDENLVVLRLVS